MDSAAAEHQYALFGARGTQKYLLAHSPGTPFDIRMEEASGEDRAYLCPVDVPLRHLGGKWKLIVCFYLLQRPCRHGELARLIPQVSQKMLTQQLRELEASGLVHREVFDQVPPRVEYSVVERERPALALLVDAVCKWGLDYVEGHGGEILTRTLPADLLPATTARTPPPRGAAHA
jgi:DNA-binding HxlR family transcriptional regulator